MREKNLRVGNTFNFNPGIPRGQEPIFEIGKMHSISEKERLSHSTFDLYIYS